MKAIYIIKHGGYDVLQVRDSPDLEPGKGQVRIRVKSCGLNFAEVMARQGLYPDAPPPPCIVGYEASGIVDKLGEGSQKFIIGSRVLAIIKFGAHADTIIANEENVFAIPDNMSFDEAAAIPVNYLTAYQMLFNVANLKSGNKVLIHMAAGGVGLAAVQLCRTVPNVTVFGTCSKGKHEFCKKMGYDHLIDYKTENYETEIRKITNNKGVDIVLDALGGKDLKIGYNLLRPMGKLISFGAANMMSGENRSLLNVAYQYMQMPTFSIMDLMDQNKCVAGVNLGHLFDQIPLFTAAFVDIMDWYSKGKIKPVIDSIYSFTEAGEAHRRIVERKNIGKVILKPVKDENSTASATTTTTTTASNS